MRIGYDREEDILMLDLDQNGQIDHAQHMDSVIIHVTESGRPVLLEILDASEFLTRAVRAPMRSEEPARRLVGQPIDAQEVGTSRAQGTLTFRANFMLVSCMNAWARGLSIIRWIWSACCGWVDLAPDAPIVVQPAQRILCLLGR